MTSVKILIVDDEAGLVKLCKIIFENAGFIVRGAVSGNQALSMIIEDMPDVILLDVMMPGMDGIELCRRICDDYKVSLEDRPFIIMYTADTREETRTSSLDAGANALITKETPVFELPVKLQPYISATD